MAGENSQKSNSKSKGKELLWKAAGWTAILGGVALGATVLFP